MEHNSALCENKGERTSGHENTEIHEGKEVVNEVEVKQMKNDSAFTTTVIKNGSEVKVDQNVILLCKKVRVCNPKQIHRCIETTAFFDAGCQRTFISDKLFNDLKLTAEKKENISIAVFGEEIPKSYDPKQVKLLLQLNEGNMKEIRAATVPILTKKLERVAKGAISGKEKGEQQLNISTIWEKPEIVIGMDYFFDLIEGFEKLASEQKKANGGMDRSGWDNPKTTGQSGKSQQRQMTQLQTKLKKQKRIKKEM
ncbi:unnamed protein product [Anisakis simplex]|uniref:DUF1758 domain-containing protein n=1 Tax=Anisakis simplex TaxID=6269 RepID=A0A0M3K2U9_ANISI|nr:unnamed protein product [Anisakis simplex]